MKNIIIGYVPQQLLFDKSMPVSVADFMIATKIKKPVWLGYSKQQKQNLENYMAFGAFTQNLMLLLHEVGIGTCWKTPAYIFEPEMRALFGVKGDESLVGFLYLTDLEDEVPHRERHLNNIIDKF